MLLAIEKPKPKKPRILSQIVLPPAVTDLQLTCLRVLQEMEKSTGLSPDRPNFPEYLARAVEDYAGAARRQNSAATYRALVDLTLKRCLTRKTDKEYSGQGRKKIRFTLTRLGERVLAYNHGRDIKLINGGFFKKGAAIRKELD